MNTLPVDRRNFIKGAALGSAGLAAFGAGAGAALADAPAPVEVATVPRKIGLVLEQRVTFLPPDPAAVEETIAAAQAVLLATQERFGFSVLGAFAEDLEAGSIVNLLGFENLLAYHSWYRDSEFDEEWLTYKNVLDFAAPKYVSQLWEVPDGAACAEEWSKAALQSQQNPAGVYTLSEVTAAPGKIKDYLAYEEQVTPAPVLTTVSFTGPRGHVLSLTAGAPGGSAYAAPSEERLADGAKLEGVRAAETRRTLYPLPYSPLQ